MDLLEREERKAILEDIKQLNLQCSFPTMVIGDNVIVGYKEKELMEAIYLETPPKSSFIRTLLQKTGTHRSI